MLQYEAQVPNYDNLCPILSNGLALILALTFICFAVMVTGDKQRVKYIKGANYLLKDDGLSRNKTTNFVQTLTGRKSGEDNEYCQTIQVTELQSDKQKTFKN